MELLRNFKELSKKDVGLAGGKGASLGEMTQAGIPVPPGFVILSASFEKFIEETGLSAEIDAILDSVNHAEIHTVENASEKIRALILAAAMPKDIAREVTASFKKLGAKYVAVRSSATAEDSASAAWAGQLDSFLNTSAPKLLENVKRCWASLFTPRAIFYRFEKGLHAQKISVAVVVQKMVESEISGIAFSVHPVTQDRNQLIIEASYGLGEAIVSGQVTPDSYVVEKEPRRIIENVVQAKTRGMYRSAKAENEWKNIPAAKAEAPALSDKQILELSDLILRIERHYGFPCDIEWAFEKAKFYIVQSRPITTLTEVINTPSFKGQLDKVELSFKEYLPLLWLYPFGSLEFSENYKKYSNTDVSVLYKIVNGELSDYQSADAPQRVYDAAKEKFRKAAFWTDLFKIYSKNIDALRRLSDDLAVHKGLGAVSNAELIKMLSLIKKVTEEVYPMTNMCYFFSLEFEDHIKEDISSLQPYHETYSSRFRKEAYKLRKRFSTINVTEKDLKREYKNDAKFRVAVDTFTEEFKYLTSVSLGTRTAESFFEDIRNASEADIQDATSLTADQKIMAQCLFYKDEISTFLIPFVKHGFAPLWNEVAKRLKISFSDLENLHIEEIVGFLHDAGGLSECLEERKEFTWGIHVGLSDEARVFQGKESVVEFDQLLKDTLVEHVGETDNVTEFRGKVGNKGVARGRVRIVDPSFKVADFEDGSVLVAVYTAPELVPIMKKAAAIVTDTGGVACHAAIVSRELKIPCVVGTKIATRVLKDGDMVEVDANNGIVKILSERTGETVFEKIYTRDTTYIMQELWAIGCSRGVEKEFGWKNPYLPGIIHYMNQGSIEIWENLRATAWLEDMVLKKNEEDPKFIDKVLKKYRAKLAIIHKFWKEKKIGVNKLAQLIKLSDEAMTYFVFYYYSALNDKTPKGIRAKALAMRNKDEFFAQNDIAIRKSISGIYPRAKNYETTLFIDEIKKISGAAALKDRKLSSLVVDGKDLFVGTLSDFQKNNPQFSFKSDTIVANGDGVIKGEIAQKGTATGPVKILRRRDQLDEVHEGDIIVSPMTTPDFLPAMRRAAAFVTDEGGITCHAGIVARELKKPCVIGTKIATQMLKDGDIVEVDADKGIVRKISSGGAGAEAASSGFSKFMTREHSFFYASIWNEADRDHFDIYVPGTNFRNMLFARNQHGVLEIYFDLGELDKVFGLIEKAIIDDPKLFNRITIDFSRYWKKLWPYVSRKKNIKSIKELKEYYENCVRWWVPMAYIFAIPDLEAVPRKLRDRALKIRKESQEYSSAVDKVYLDFFQAKFPCQIDLMPLLMPEEVYRADKLSRRDIAEIEKRRSELALATINGTSSLVDPKSLLPASNLLPNLDGITEFKGTPAYKGVRRGRVKKIHSFVDMEYFSAGEVLVTEMTNPDYVPIMKKAAAIVTDEGGTTCHAAIASRELKVPCIVGTKIATQVLKDGDMVEVDANKGIVKILEKDKVPASVQDPFGIKKSDYVLTFWTSGVSVLLADICKDMYKALDPLYSMTQGRMLQYFHKDKFEWSQQEGIRFYSDKKSFTTYRTNLRKLSKEFTGFYLREIKNRKKITQKQAEDFFRLCVAICREYTLMDYEYTDRAFLLQNKNKTVRQNLKALGSFKDEMRAFLNKALFEEDSYLENFLAKISAEFGVSRLALGNYIQSEVIDIFNGVKVGKEILRQREKNFVVSVRNDMESYYMGAVAAQITGQLEEKIEKNLTTITGQVANRGKITGRVKIITIDYSNWDGLKNDMEKMGQGDILVAETTSPELMLACKKASAIVTDIGGMMSHAAIVSRELGIPCIVGTKLASKVLKDGDMVEVDANKGVVTIYKK